MEKEKVNHPSHYNYGKIEVISAIDDWDLNFNLGNAVKYIARAKHKENEIEDLKKAIWYIQREIEKNTPHTCAECAYHTDVWCEILETKTFADEDKCSIFNKK